MRSAILRNLLVSVLRPAILATSNAFGSAKGTARSRHTSRRTPGGIGTVRTMILSVSTSTIEVFSAMGVIPSVPSPAPRSKAGESIATSRSSSSVSQVCCSFSCVRCKVIFTRNLKLSLHLHRNSHSIR